MPVTEFKTYNLDNLKETYQYNWGSGSYGDVKCFFDIELKKKVVGKIFPSSGNQKKITTQFALARREAKIHAQFKHKNIISVLGAEAWNESSFAIFLEFAPCGDLESLLHQEKELSLSWKLRARFFSELADALDYLHNHDPKRSYIHGDLKPQNVLLGDVLQIKLGDFGSTAIDQLTGASSLAITGCNNTQHTPYYTAPEYLRNPAKEKSTSMDIYSFGMTGYEIITRQVVFSTANVKCDIVLHLIMTQGRKPDEKVIDEVENEEDTDHKIYANLKKMVKQCWKTEPDNRPTILEVKKRLQGLAHSKQIYGTATNEEVNVLSAMRKQQLERQPLPERYDISSASENLLSWYLQPPPEISRQERLYAFLLMIAIIGIYGVLTPLIYVVYNPFGLATNVRVVLNLSDCFLAINSTKLSKYDFHAQTISFVSNHYTPHKDSLSKMKLIYKVNDRVYVCSDGREKGFRGLNCAADLSSSWKKYKHSNYVGFNYAHYADPFASVKQTVVIHNQIYAFGDGISLKLNAFADQLSTWKRLDW